MEDESQRSLATRRVIAGAAAGALGGLAGAAVKQLCEAIVPPRTLVHAMGGGDLSKERKGTISLAVHWVFSTLTSALYGATVARFPRARFASGVGFGLVVWGGLHEIIMPLLGATPALSDLPAQEQLNEFITHSLFGATVESIRGTIVTP